MYISEELLRANVENPANHLNKMYKCVLDFERIKDDKNEKREFELLPLLESIGLMNSFCKKYKLPLIVIAEGQAQNIHTVRAVFHDHYKRFLISNTEIHSHYFEKETYVFFDSEFDIIQNNINFLREEITKSKIFSDEHKSRLLDKIEMLQSELHKKMNRLDKIQGALVSMARTFGEMGTVAKPMFDRVNETLKIVFRVEDKGDNVPASNNEIGYEQVIQVEMVEEE